MTFSPALAPGMPQTKDGELQAPGARLPAQYCSVREQSLALCEPLTPEDMMMQSCPEASPAKWHLAHTSWFFETFLLREFAAGYQPFDPDFLWLFNSYYNSVSDQPAKKLRASFSRPTLEAVLGYRRHVDAAMQALLREDLATEAERRVVLGLHHEQQHQELLVTDIKHAFWSNPLRPVYSEGSLPGAEDAPRLTPQRWLGFAGGVQEIGYGGESFCFDNEEPRHRVYLQPFELATRPVSCAEYLQFIEDGGYHRADLWLAEGWQTVQDQGWEAPLYWHRQGAEWRVFTLRGDLALNVLLAAPICHVSYFEADAFSRWAGCRLPTEAEWEVAVACSGRRAAAQNMLEGGTLHPVASAYPDHLANPGQPGQPDEFDQLVSAERLDQAAGGVWEWTASAYLGYPGYNAVPGALGEYNGKFMSSQMVLRGGSVATPVSHIRPTYRNFFPPATRWQFSGLRLARR
jgi:ergothioneine biosynthesis protein EgtB